MLEQEVINVQEKNSILHKRLETMLNEVMDSVNTDHIAQKLAELKEQKDGLTTDVERLEKEIADWEAAFREENGREPTDEDRFVIIHLCTRRQNDVILTF